MRDIDWDEFIDSHDYRYGVLLKDMAEGKDVLSHLKEWGQKYSQVRVLKEKMEVALRSTWDQRACRIPCGGQRGLVTFMRNGNVRLAGYIEQREVLRLRRDTFL